MPHPTKILLLISALTLCVSAHARTWTSVDGRTLEASFVTRGDDFVVLRLDATGATVTVKYSQLSPEDVEYAKQQPKGNAPDPQKLQQLIARFPKLNNDDENARQLYLKYHSYTKTMTPGNALGLLAMMRRSLPQDVAYWKEQSEIKPPVIQWIKISGNQPAVKAAHAKMDRYNKAHAMRKACHRWLSTSLPQWMAEVEKVAGAQ